MSEYKVEKFLLIWIYGIFANPDVKLEFIYTISNFSQVLKFRACHV